ncbi:MAG: VOC family protein [Pseudomonadales bacterium]
MDRPTDRTIFQNAWVVDDLEAAMNKWVSEMGIGPFFVTEHGPQFKDVYYRGEPSELHMNVALAQAGPMQVELIQPISTQCAYRDSVPVGTTMGFHHMCVWTHDIDADTEYFAGLGYPAANSADAGLIRFAYYDTRPLLGCMLEVVEKAPSVEAMFGRIAEVCASWDGKDPIRSSADLF